MPKHLDRFYSIIGLPLAQFQLEVDKEFVARLKKWQIAGGASTSERKQAIQEAVDALAVYDVMGFPQAQQKRQAFLAVYTKHYKTALPPSSPDVLAIATKTKGIEAKYNVLVAKFMLLDYWEGVAKGTVEPDYAEDGSHWALHEFLNFEPMKVRPILEMMLDDAKKILSKPYTATLDTWRGAEASRSFSHTKDSISRIIKAEASAKIGAEVTGKFEMEYKGFKLKAKAEAFAGARAQASGEIVTTSSSLAMKGEVEVEVGIRLKGNVNVDFLDVLEIEAGVDALAGAMAKAEFELEIAGSGVKFKASAEAFAGAKLTGTAKGTLKLGGRKILSTEAKGSLMAGAGASAEMNFECGIFGNVAFGAKAGVAVGLGAETGFELSIDAHNLKWAAANLFWAALNDAGWKNKGKVWFLPVEENVVMCGKLRDAMFQMMGEVYRQNETEFAKLQAWNALQTQVTKAVLSRNPKLATLMSP